MTRVCIYPGSFDPPTLGHIDMIRRARELYDRVVVAVLENASKRGNFAPEERKRLLERCLQQMDGVEVLVDGGLLVDVARRAGANVIVRGLRGESDCAIENQMAVVNRKLSGIETVFLFPQPEYGYLSSTVVRDVARHGGDLAGLAPEAIIPDIMKRFQRQEP